MSIVTRTGDGGTTSLWSGERVDKDDLRVECYGTIDELSSFLGMARHACADSVVLEAVTGIQRDLYRAAAELASPGRELPDRIGAADEARISAMIGGIETALGLVGFVIPGMTPGSAALDVARTVARRAERRLVSLARVAPVSQTLRNYVNRLSDFIFILARKEEAAVGKVTYVRG